MPTCWKKIRDISAYETDPATADTTGLGAIVSDGEWVYWGTMHLPGVSTLRHFGEVVRARFPQRDPGHVARIRPPAAQFRSPISDAASSGTSM